MRRWTSARALYVLSVACFLSFMGLEAYMATAAAPAAPVFSTASRWLFATGWGVLVGALVQDKRAKKGK